jgi:DNA-binding NarL/FixJ family response regulator
MSGVECVPRIAEMMPETHIIMLTVYDDTDAIFQSLAAGAGGYLLKPVRRAQLLDAIRDVLRGGAPMSSTIARCVVQAFRKPAPVKQSGGEISQLSPREREILELLAQGLLLKEIADHFKVTHPTIQTHIGRIYKKLHVHSRAQAVARLKER